MAILDFDQVWERIIQNLITEKPVLNWTARHGYLGDDMTAIIAIGDMVLVKSPRAKEIQRVPKEDFQAVWQVWPEYCAGKIQRRQVTTLTRFSKYIISIFHWIGI